MVEQPLRLTMAEDGTGFVVESSVRIEIVDGVPAGRRTVDVVDGHTVRVRVSGTSPVIERFVASPGERWMGFGERSNLVSMAQGEIEHYVGEGPYQDHEYPLLEGTVPPWGMRQRPDATYFPVPWALSTRGYGVLLDNDELSSFHFRTESADRWHVEVESNELSYRLFVAGHPLGALGAFTRATGRQPEPQRWFFGPWFQTGHENHVPLETERMQLERQVAAGAVVVAAETHCRYLPLGEDRGHEASEQARTTFFHEQGLKVVSYLNPLVSVDYPEAFEPAAAAGALQKTAAGDVYLFQAYAGGRVPPFTRETQYDFTTRAATECWGAVAQRLVGAGYDGWMEDFGEYTPLDAVQSDGSTGSAAHNRYPSDFHRAAATATARLERETGRTLARFVRSGWRGTAPHVPIVWGGDPTTSWGFDGLTSAVIEGLSMGASGIAMWGSDCGGFFSSFDRLTPELLKRWIEFAAFSPVMRTKSQGIELPPYQRPQVWDDEILPTWVRYTRIHARLVDYLEQAHAVYRATGRPIMAALELVHPDEPLVAGVIDEYYFGPDLVVAPVLEPGVSSRRVVLPPGTWVDAFSTSAPDVHGPATLDVAISVEDIPVFRRADTSLSLA